MFRQLCGDSTLKNVVIVTNMWGEVRQEVGNAREDELANEDLFFKPVLAKGAIMLRHDNNQDSAQSVLRHILKNHPLSLQIQRELVDEKKDISQTAAGAELNRELMVQIERHRKEMKELQAEMQGRVLDHERKVFELEIRFFPEAIRVKDEETKRELEIESRKLQKEMDRVQSDAQKLASVYSEEKRSMEMRLQQLIESSRAEVEQQREERRGELAILERRLHESSLESARERENVLRRMQELQLQQSRHSGQSGFFGMIGRVLDMVFGIL